MIRGNRKAIPEWDGLPRTRGDDPSVAMVMTQTAGFAPHARG